MFAGIKSLGNNEQAGRQTIGSPLVSSEGPRQDKGMISCGNLAFRYEDKECLCSVYCAIAPTPGGWKSGKSGQLPSFPGSPPMRTQLECDGVGPSRMNIWYQLGGETKAFGGATTVQVLPLQENSGKSVRMPMELPINSDH